MLFLTLCWFLPSGTGLIGVYNWNVIYKTASRIPKISTHVIFFKERSVMVKTWINYIVMILYVFVCVFAARMLYNEFSMLYLKGINYCRQILLQHNFCDWKDKKKRILWHKSLHFRTLSCIFQYKLLWTRVLLLLLTLQKYHCSIVK